MHLRTKCGKKKGIANVRLARKERYAEKGATICGYTIMPMYAFLCSNGHEFEAIVSVKASISKWCKYCDQLTQWETVNGLHSPHYKENVCTNCHGNEHIVPVLPVGSPQVEESVTKECPICGKLAEHVLRVEERGGENAMHPASSISFRLNYMEPSD